MKKDILQTKQVIEEVKKAQAQLEKDQANSLLQMKVQILEEVDAKLDKNAPTENQEDKRQASQGEWVKRASAPPNNTGNAHPDRAVPKYAEMEKRVEKITLQTTNTNGALCLLYVNDWKNESIGAVKKVLRV